MTFLLLILLVGLVPPPPVSAPSDAGRDLAAWPGADQGLEIATRAEPDGALNADRLLPKEGHWIPPALAERIDAQGSRLLGADAGASPPGDLDHLLGSLLDTESRLPLPEPDPEHPLAAALDAYAAVLGVPLPPPPELALSIAALDLGDEGESALARLVLAYTQAVTLRREATAVLTEDERRFVALDPESATAWFNQDDARTWDDYQAEAMRILAKTDQAKSLQAADLLARAVEAVRGPLARAAAAPNANDAGTWGLMEGVLRLAGAGGPDGLEPSSLREALGALHAAYGMPAPPADRVDLGLPPSLDRAVASLVNAKAEGLRAGDAAQEAQDFLAAARAARPTLEAWAAILRLEKRLDAGAGADGAAPSLPGRGAASDLEQARLALAAFADAAEAAARSLTPAQREAAGRTAAVEPLLRQASWSDPQARRVESWALAHAAMEAPALQRLRSASAAVALLPDADGDGCPDALQLALPTRCGEARNAAGEHRALSSLSEGFGQPRPAAGPTRPDDLLFDDAFLAPASPFCEEREDGCSDPASLLRIGGVEGSTYGHVAVIHIDLGGDDLYTGELAGPAYVRLRDGCVAVSSPCAPALPQCVPAPAGPALCAPACPDRVPCTLPCLPSPAPCALPCQPAQASLACSPVGCPPVPTSPDCTPSAECGARNQPPACVSRRALGRGSYAVEVGGNDAYDTPGSSETQGSAPNGGASILIDFAGDDTYAANRRSQGFAAAGNPGVQGTGAGASTGGGVGLLVDLRGNDTYAGNEMSQANAPTGVGGLFDFGGDDRYLFERQGSLPSGSGIAMLFDAVGRDAYHSAHIAIDGTDVDRNPAPAFVTQGWFGPQGKGLAAFIDQGPEQDAYSTIDLDGQSSDLSASKNDRRWPDPRPNLDGNGPNGGVGNGTGVFFDGQAFDPDSVNDPDRDGVPTFLEDALGTDPSDNRSNPGNAFWILTGDGVGSTDPDHAAGLDREGAWLSPPSMVRQTVPGQSVPVSTQTVRTPTQALALPGMMIAGRADDTHLDWVPFLVDLGGDDRYIAPNAGGISPTVAGLATSLHGPGAGVEPAWRPVAGGPPTDVALLLDLGAGAGGGNDLYAPDEEACTFRPSAPQNFIVGGGSGVVRDEVGNYMVPAACPSLGGALNGVAFLGDDGGSNVFRGTLRMDVRAATGTNGDRFKARVAGFGVTQGAGLFDGIGVLATWNATNVFESLVDVRAAEVGGSSFQAPAAPVALAQGVAQGAGVGGVGLLAAFGMGSDSYTITARATAMQPTTANFGVAEARGQGAGVSGVGILFDGGGANQFRAPEGLAQGFATHVGLPAATAAAGSAFDDASVLSPRLMRPAMGVLMIGQGDDVLDAGPLSQASGVRIGPDLSFGANGLPLLEAPSVLALLVDAGGSDTYRVHPHPFPAPGLTRCPFLEGQANCALAQGAGALRGVALLLDLEGDDRYEAEGMTHVQGAGVLGTGALVDHSGHDAYVALERAQGYAAHDSLAYLNGHSAAQFTGYDQTPALGLLLDRAGWDAYTAAGRGQGFGELVATHPLAFVPGQTVGSPPATTNLSPTSVGCSGPCPAVGLGILLDATGTDAYLYGGTKCQLNATVTGLCLPPDADGNGWRWSQPSASQGILGIGVDADDLEAAHALLDPLAPPGTTGGMPVQVGLELGRHPSGNDAAACPAVPVSGTLYLVATVAVSPDFGGTVQRVDFFVDGILLGAGTRLEGTQKFLVPWKTVTPNETVATQRHRDGVHSLVASAFVDPGPAAVAGQRPTAVAVAQVESPTCHVQLDNAPLVEASLSNGVIAQESLEASRLEVRLGRDLGPGTGEPGGHVTVTLRRLADGSTTVLDEADRVAGAFFLTIAKSSCALGCGDGLYDIRVQAEDGAGQAASTTVQLLMDSRPPASAVTMGGVSNATYKVVGEPKARVTWAHTDVPEGGLARDASGVRNVTVLRLDAKGDLLESLGTHEAGVGETVTDAVSGEWLRILTVATDTAGNSESPCGADPPEQAPCYRAKLAQGGAVETLLDFVKPELSNLEASRDVIRPGDVVNFTVRAKDTGSGLQTVGLRFLGAFTDATMQPIGQDMHVHQGVAWVPEGSPPQETPFVYTAVAEDRGGNRRLLSGSGILDSDPPRVHRLDPVYGDGNATAARPGSAILLQARVVDAAPASAAVDLSGFDASGAPSGPDTVSCSTTPTAPNIWQCQVIVPDVPDGEYPLRWMVRDVAGNLNADEVTVVPVNQVAPTLMEVEATDVQHDGFTIRWRTSIEATSQVQYGIGSATSSIAVNTSCAADVCHGTVHRVDVRGLAAATDYTVRAVSVSRSGVPGEATALIVRTGNSYRLDLPGLQPGAAFKGVSVLPVQSAELDGKDTPIDVEVRVQDAAGRSSPRPVGRATATDGVANVEFDTTKLPDGEYRLFLHGARAGESLRVALPVIRIDNNGPFLSPLDPAMQSRIADSRPTLALSVLDPLSDSPVPLQGLQLVLDGNPAPVDGAQYDSAGAAGSLRRLTVPLAGDLGDGKHRVQVLLPDAAGNPGIAQWEFTVDTRPPVVSTAHVVHPDGLRAARPGSILHVEANVTDGSGVASGRIDLGPLGVVPLLHGSGTIWSADAPVPLAARDGAWETQLVFADSLGNEGPAGSVRIVVDAQAPRLLIGSAQARGMTRLALTVEASEPVTLRAASGSSQAANGTAAVRHQVLLDGLRPGVLHNVSVSLTDTAGNVATAVLQGATQGDVDPPTAIQLEAASPREGVVRLAWTPASDNAGVAAYRVERLEETQWRVLASLPANASAFEDAGAPAGRMASYRVAAVDVAGLAGPPAQILLQVLALPHLWDPDVSPRSGDAQHPFTFEVMYRHAAGGLPDIIGVEYGTLRIPLHRVGNATDCATGCRMGASALLPVADLASRAPGVVFFASHEGQETRIPLSWSPRVSAGNQGGLWANDAHSVAAIGAPALLAAMLVALALALATNRRKT